MKLCCTSIRNKTDDHEEYIVDNTLSGTGEIAKAENHQNEIK